MSLFIKGALAGTGIAVAIIFGVLFLNYHPTITSTDSDGVSCLGWQRTGAMSTSENQQFESIKTSCELYESEKINKILYFNKEQVSVGCHPNAQSVSEPIQPTLTLSVKNVGTKSIFLPQHSWAIEYDNSSSNNKLEFSVHPEAHPNLIREVLPSETLEFKHSPKLPGYGKYEIGIMFGAWKYKSITANSIYKKRGWEVTANCELIWRGGV